MRGVEVLEYLKGNNDYVIKDEGDSFMITWRDGEPVSVPKILIEEGITQKHLEKLCHNGRNLEQITRVTGYMSKVSGWNKGKIAELKDRHREGSGKPQANFDWYQNS